MKSNILKLYYQPSRISLAFQITEFFLLLNNKVGAHRGLKFQLNPRVLSPTCGILYGQSFPFWRHFDFEDTWREILSSALGIQRKMFSGG